ncbi:MAG: GerMN domain-containing protein [Acidobacteria bacterium]|nr:GerMN domain-containing protein [Acidobacteriota bacterium]
MSRNDPEFPWRVIAISVMLFGALVFAAWMILVPGGSGDSGVAAGTGGTVETPPVLPTAAAATAPAVRPAVVDPQTPEPAADTTALDSTGPEALEALSIARAEAGTMDLQLFLIIPGLERLIPVPRTVPAPATIDAQVRRAVEELINWTGTQTVSPVAPESRVREVWVSRGGIAYIDFGRSFSDFSGGGSLGELHTVYSIVATLTESFPEIFAVQFLVEGEQIETLAGHVDLSRPLLPSADWVLIEQGDATDRRSQQSGGARETGDGG